MTKIIEFKPKKKKAPVRRNARRGLSIIDKFEEINKQWHENEKKFMPHWNDFKGPERKYWKEAFRIYRAQNKLLRLIATKTELKKQIKDDLLRYEKNFIRQNKGYYKFIESIKKLNK